MLRKGLRSFQSSAVDSSLCVCVHVADWPELHIRCVCEGKDSEGGAALSSPRSTFHCCSSLTSNTIHTHTAITHSLTEFLFIYVMSFFVQEIVFSSFLRSPAWDVLVTIWTNPNTVGVFFLPLDLITTKLEQKSNSIEMQHGALRNIRGRWIDEKLHLVECWSAEKQNSKSKPDREEKDVWLWVCPSWKATVSLCQQHN